MFRPNDIISKDELTAVLIRLVMNEYNETEGPYRAQNYIKLLENNTSIPLNDVTRGNTAEVLYDLYRYNTYTLVDEVGYVLQ